MKLYNTLTKQVEDINPQSPPKVSVYTCGPTVYDYPHIGNWFTFIRYDILVRTLKNADFDPEWALNITDVGHLVSDADEGEDKLEKGARREGKTAQAIAESYSDYFIKGLDRLNFTKPSHLPKATHHIAEQIELIKQLEQKGYTYQIDDGIYYDTSKFPQYNRFANLDLDEQQAGARVDVNPQKRNPSDFALWKFSPKDHQRDMEWESPWGVGFPGWHIECSAMIHKYFGDTVDIHSGGIDHIPVHHTNEIAQSQAVTGKPLAKYWMHTNHILVEDEKISKSTGNGITLEDIEARGFSLQAFRLMVLQSHYRSQSAFSWESLQAAQNRLDAYRAMSALRWQTVDTHHESPPISVYTEAIAEAMENDLNTPELLSKLSLVDGVLSTNLLQARDKAQFEDLLNKVDALTGLTLSDEPDISDDQKQKIMQRSLARDNQDWEASDKIRQELENKGILVRDTHAGPIWYRK